MYEGLERDRNISRIVYFFFKKTYSQDFHLWVWLINPLGYGTLDDIN